MPPPVEESMSDAESTGTSIPFDNSGEKEDAEDMKEDKIKDEVNGDDDDDQDDDEDLYVVEKIIDHDFAGKGGALFLRVKWKGYEKEEDMTWEPEDGVTEGAQDVVDEYYKKIGGRPEKPVKKRKSRGADTPQPTPDKSEPKKRRKSKARSPNPEHRPLTILEEEHKWGEKDVLEVSTIEPTPEGHKALLLLTNGKKASVQLALCNKRCPQKMLQFYEAHLTFTGHEKN